MNTIIFNETEFEVESYSKNTYFGGEEITSVASCTIFTDNITALHSVAEETINIIQIKHDNELIYDLRNAGAHIDSISEYLNGSKMNINVSLTFSEAE